MTARSPLPERARRFLKSSQSLIPRLASPHDGEVIATARAVGRALQSPGCDWHDLAKAAATAPPPPRPPSRAESNESTEMRARLEAISRESRPNESTAGFVGDLLRRSSLDGLTGKQTACVNRIIRQAYDRGVRVDRRAA
jgi:hypothetical protein